MRYSYTKHRRKSAFTEDMQLLLIFFTITLLMLLLTYVFLLFKDYKFDEAKKNLTQKKVDLNISIYNMKKEITFIEKQSILAETIHTKNAVLKDSISNLFDLVPQRITLSEATLLENGLILNGITPNKNVYNFMLQAPLRSIFHRTYSSFYPAENGWFRFVSTNYIDKEDEEIELDEE